MIWLITFGFFFFQIWAFLFRPRYREARSVTFLTEETLDDNKYLIQPGDFLPTFVVRTRLSKSSNNQNSTEEFYNSDFIDHLADVNHEELNNFKLFDFYFERYDRTEENIARVPAILCKDYINGPYWKNYSQEEK